MKFAHAFWSKPLLNKKFADLQTGLAITLVDYAISVELLHKLGYKITLYTDEEGANILKEIPYDKVVILDNLITDNYHFAASIKFAALQKMSLDECLIDGDIFFRKMKAIKFIEDSKADFICSFFEDKSVIANFDGVSDLLKLIRKHKFEKPYNTPTYKDCEGWLNTSVMKFNNQDLKDEYIAQYIYHLDQLKDASFNKLWPDIIIEQYHLTQLCKDKGYSVDFIVPDYSTNNSEEYALELGFTHLGTAKRKIHNKLVKYLAVLNLNLTQKLFIFIKNYGEKNLSK